MKLFFAGLILLIPTITNGQINDTLKNKILAPSEMQEDLNVYVRLLSETHPGLHRYLSPNEFDKTVNNIRKEITEPLNFYTYYKLLAGLTSKIRCAHTQLYPTERVLDYIGTNVNLFPFFVYPVQDKLYVIFNGTENEKVNPGYELVSINGNNVASIKNTIESYYHRDGIGESVLLKFLQGTYFSMYYYFLVEQPESYKVNFISTEGKAISIEVPGATLAAINSNYVKNPVNSEMLGFYNKTDKNWNFEIVQEIPSTAKIRISSFGGKGMDTEDKAQEAIQTFMDKAIKKMERKNIQNLILELRSNPGGWDIQGHELLSYFLKSDTPVDYYTRLTAITKDSEFLKYSDLPLEELKETDQYLIKLDDTRYSLNPDMTKTFRTVNPKEQRFEGTLYILIDEQCSSTCAEFVAMAKSEGIGILIGNEAGGAYEGGNGSTYIHFSLPNSGIYSYSPLVQYELAVNPVAQKGMGTIPHHKILPSLEDLLTGNKAIEAFVYSLIQKEGN